MTPALASAIESHVKLYPVSRLARLDAQPGLGTYAIKYMPARYAGTYWGANGHLRISTTPGFTWGSATYVSHISNPLSSAIFGRGGVVARYRPYGWRIFDATDRKAQGLYLDWAKMQVVFGRLMLTMHSNWHNTQIRNLFRTDFHINCVLFHPDQWNHRYTRRHHDIWMAVSDFDMNGSLTGLEMSDEFNDPRLTVVIAEEFEAAKPQIPMRLKALMSPVGPPHAGPAVAPDIVKAYKAAGLYYTRL